MYTITFLYLGQLMYITYEEHNEPYVYAWLLENAEKGLVTAP